MLRNLFGRLAVIATFWLVPSAGFAQASAECMSTYYQSHDPSCLDAIMAWLNGEPKKAGAPNVIGFFAALASTTPDEFQRIAGQSGSEGVKALMLSALISAGKRNEASAFAHQNGFESNISRVPETAYSFLEKMSPRYAPAENDILIGAYMATGDGNYIKRILENFKTTDDRMASDGMRFGLMSSKFGPSLAPKQRPTIRPVAALCDKHQCKTAKEPFLRLITLGSAIWALQSLGSKDAGVRTAFSDFFAADQRLGALLKVEQTALNNYVLTLVAAAAIKDQPAIERSLQIYETFGPASEATEALRALQTPK